MSVLSVTPKLCAIASILSLGLCALAARAHHSQQPFFHMDRNLEISGTVVRFDFINPHPVIVVDVVDESGGSVRWEVEGPTAIYLSRTGWTADSLLPGDEITVRGAPPKKVGAHALAGREVRKADGTVLRLYTDDARRVLELAQ